LRQSHYDYPKELFLAEPAPKTSVCGFRSSFRDWVGNVSGFPREVTETALAHVIGDKAEQAQLLGRCPRLSRALAIV
jgi:hypothetical protein